MSGTQPTPTPWEFDTYTHITAKGGYHKFAPDIIQVCSIPDHPEDYGYTPEQSSERSWWYAESAANAAYIVKAVNAHEKLVEALKACANWIKETADSGDCGSFIAEDVDEWVAAKAALKLAGEEL